MNEYQFYIFQNKLEYDVKLDRASYENGYRGVYFLDETGQILDPLKNFHKPLIVIAGPPRAGKSSLSKLFSSYFPTWKILSQDNYFLTLDSYAVQLRETNGIDTPRQFQVVNWIDNPDNPQWGNWDCPSCLDWDAILVQLHLYNEDMAVDGIVLEGFMALQDARVLRHALLIYYLDIDKQTC